MEHCISAFSERQKEQAYRNYVTEGLRMISRNTALIASISDEEVEYIDKTFDEVIHPRADTRTGDEIVEDVLSGIGL